MAFFDTNEFKGTVANASTTFVGCGGEDDQITAIHIQWGTAFIGTFTFEASNRQPSDVTLTSVTKGEWIQYNPSTAYISVTSTDGTTGGATVTNMTITVAGGVAGGAFVDIGNSGARRIRTKAAATTGDLIIIKPVGKR